jgi:Fe-S cluster assembly iron-binding protein IscA
MALDEPSDMDKVEKVEDIQFVVDNDLCNIYQGFTIESVKQDDQILFRITPAVQQSSCGSCSSCS